MKNFLAMFAFVGSIIGITIGGIECVRQLIMAVFMGLSILNVIPSALVLTVFCALCGYLYEKNYCD